jgi:hypothetical protein
MAAGAESDPNARRQFYQSLIRPYHIRKMPRRPMASLIGGMLIADASASRGEGVPLIRELAVCVPDDFADLCSELLDQSHSHRHQAHQ